MNVQAAWNDALLKKRNQRQAEEMESNTNIHIEENKEHLREAANSPLVSVEPEIKSFLYRVFL